MHSIVHHAHIPSRLATKRAYSYPLDEGFQPNSRLPDWPKVDDLEGLGKFAGAAVLARPVVPFFRLVVPLPGNLRANFEREDGIRFLVELLLCPRMRHGLHHLHAKAWAHNMSRVLFCRHSAIQTATVSNIYLNIEKLRAA